MATCLNIFSLRVTISFTGSCSVKAVSFSLAFFLLVDYFSAFGYQKAHYWTSGYDLKLELQHRLTSRYRPPSVTDHTKGFTLPLLKA